MSRPNTKNLNGKLQAFWSKIESEDADVYPGNPMYRGLMRCATGGMRQVVEDIQGLSYGETQTFLYGSPFIICNKAVLCRIRLLNGFGDAVNTNTYINNSAGSLLLPFKDGCFMITLATCGLKGNGDRVRQFSAETQSLTLAANAVPGRKLYLIRGQTYNFSYMGACSTAGMTLDNCAQISTDSFLYVTTDCVGGGPSNAINGGPNGQMPPRFSFCQDIAIGTIGCITVNDNLPPTFWIQASHAPFIGLQCFVLEPGMGFEGLPPMDQPGIANSDMGEYSSQMGTGGRMGNGVGQCGTFC